MDRRSAVPRPVRAAALALPAALLVAPLARAQQGPVVFRVPVTGTIELGLAPFVERSVREAEASGADAVVLEINTPGGRVDAAERIADALTRAAVPVHAFVNPRAFSAGALISLAADRIWMPPGAVIGAATPVDASGAKAPEKIVSAMRTEMRALAEARGLDPRIAEAMVDETIEEAGVVEAGRLLTLTTEEAIEVGYAAPADGLEGLLAALGLEGAEVRTMEVNWAERVVRFLSHPVVSPFLLSLGFLGLLVEIKSPGLGMAGAAGALSLALFFGSHLIIGLAGWEDVILFSAGVALVLIEALVIPGFGIFGVLGIVGIVAGLYLSLVGDLATMPDLARAGAVLTTTILLVGVTGWAVARHLVRSGRLARSGIVLGSATSSDAGYQSAPLRTDLVGREGVAITDLRPAGVALVGDERIDVVSESEWVEEGTAVKILRAEGYRHIVRPSPGKGRDAPENSTEKA